jgi:hypothetical protein
MVKVLFEEYLKTYEDVFTAINALYNNQGIHILDYYTFNQIDKIADQMFIS